MLLCSALALFLLFQSHSLWESPTLVPDRWPDLFYPMQHAFPREWLLAQHTSWLGTLNAFLLLAILTVWFGAYLSTVRRLFAGAPSGGEASRMYLLLILGVTTVIMLIFFASPGMFSGDLHSYISYGRI